MNEEWDEPKRNEAERQEEIRRLTVRRRAHGSRQVPARAGTSLNVFQACAAAGRSGRAGKGAPAARGHAAAEEGGHRRVGRAAPICLLYLALCMSCVCRPRVTQSPRLPQLVDACGTEAFELVVPQLLSSLSTMEQDVQASENCSCS